MNEDLKDILLPVMVGEPDISTVRRFAEKYGSPIIVVGKRCGFTLRFLGIVEFYKVPSYDARILSMCLNHIAEENPDSMPLLTWSGDEYAAVVGEIAPALEGKFIIWRNELNL